MSEPNSIVLEEASEDSTEGHTSNPLNHATCKEVLSPLKGAMDSPRDFSVSQLQRLFADPVDFLFSTLIFGLQLSWITLCVIIPLSIGIRLIGYIMKAI